MAEILMRMGEKRFYDGKAFPRGFAKSGNFTILEEELLTYYGDTMAGLESGELDAENAEEKHFLKALKDPKKANTKLETTWLKYIKLARGRKVFHTLSSKKPTISQSLVELTEESSTTEYED
ncbi:DUF413 domain-containing protein [uncultured Vibrio sp.]|uniref:DUF413 domain-containing protein n=1 Tax=uncultured Vibrio sp. TaxID=114054 RepID=UPI002602BE22|nr:DUF413 domain-containing protein [uncultured Vibrio sp.]